MGTHDISLEPGAREEGAHPMPYKAEGASSELVCAATVAGAWGVDLGGSQRHTPESLRI